MKKGFFCRLVVILTVLSVMLQPFYVRAGTLDQIRSIAKSVLSGEPEEVEELRQMEVAQSEEGHQEYYFKQLNEEEQRVYRELLKGIRAREKDFYLTLSQDDSIDRCYHAVLKDHPEIFWVHNHEKIYKTTYSDSDYCTFTPGYIYTESEISEIQNAMEAGFQEVSSLIPADASDYEKVRIVYTYVIDNTQKRGSLCGICRCSSISSGKNRRSVHLCRWKHAGKYRRACMEYCKTGWRVLLCRCY